MFYSFLDIGLLFLLGRYIPKCFITYVAMVNGIVFLISLSVFSLLVYRIERFFCMLILCPTTLLYSLISSSNFLVESLHFSMKRIMSVASNESFTSSFPIWIPFYLFFCSDCCANISKTMLNGSGESGHPCLFPDWGKYFLFFTIEDNVCCGFTTYTFYYVEVCSFYSSFLEAFCHKWILNLIKGFFYIY